MTFDRLIGIVLLRGAVLGVSCAAEAASFNTVF